MELANKTCVFQAGKDQYPNLRILKVVVLAKIRLPYGRGTLLGFRQPH